eukprot:10004992-Lingulodinium_polyedra.AAC.1
MRARSGVGRQKLHCKRGVWVYRDRGAKFGSLRRSARPPATGGYRPEGQGRVAAGVRDVEK